MIEGKNSTPLARLLEQDTDARDYYDSLHAFVRSHLEEYAQDILSPEDLSRISNRIMSETLSDLGGIYDDN